MTTLDMTLASAVDSPWYYGLRVSERMELAIIFLLFIGTLAVVYYIQRWIGDY